jgi:hypothetical protein
MFRASQLSCQSHLTILSDAGNYHKEIYDALKHANWPIDPTQVNYDYYLYRCHEDGTISKTDNCPYGCVDGGSNNSDRCE